MLILFPALGSTFYFFLDPTYHIKGPKNSVPYLKKPSYASQNLLSGYTIPFYAPQTPGFGVGNLPGKFPVPSHSRFGYSFGPGYDLRWGSASAQTQQYPGQVAVRHQDNGSNKGKVLVAVFKKILKTHSKESNLMCKKGFVVGN